ncbi:MAG TPA: phage tail tube protein [Frateuria sp.]|uniref:phage tail tube protein n=1 Tax=Frateuria sp. TaxID=2211372 RepID=UPI002D808A1D|nr:phage tail tube protein [Frateuria sp.]HET6805324.1 phage tail tube protein [Frateuria sp.]
MPQVRGSNVRLIGVTDDSFATPPASPSAVILPFVQNNVKADQQRDTDDTISGFRGAARSVAGNRTVGGTLQVNAAPQTIGFLLKHLLGAPTSTTATGVTTHVFGVAASGASALPPSFTLESDLGAAFTAASRYVRLTGCRIAQAQFAVGPSGFMQVTPTITGSGYSKSGTPLDASPDDTGHAAFSTLTASLVFGGGALPLDVTKLDFTIGNNLDEDTYVIGGNGNRGDLPEGLLTVSGTVEALLKDSGLLDAALADTDSSLVLTLTRGTGDGTDGNESLEINIPALVFATTTPTVPGPKGVRLQASFTGHRTTGEIGVTATLKTPLATIN